MRKLACIMCVISYGIWRFLDHCVMHNDNYSFHIIIPLLNIKMTYLFVVNLLPKNLSDNSNVVILPEIVHIAFCIAMTIAQWEKPAYPGAWLSRSLLIHAMEPLF